METTIEQDISALLTEEQAAPLLIKLGLQRDKQSKVVESLNAKISAHPQAITDAEGIVRARLALDFEELEGLRNQEKIDFGTAIFELKAEHATALGEVRGELAIAGTTIRTLEAAAMTAADAAKVEIDAAKAELQTRSAQVRSVTVDLQRVQAEKAAVIAERTELLAKIELLENPPVPDLIVQMTETFKAALAGLPEEMRGQFGLPFAVVKFLMLDGETELAIGVIQSIAVPEELEPVKQQLLALVTGTGAGIAAEAAAEKRKLEV